MLRAPVTVLGLLVVAGCGGTGDTPSDAPASAAATPAAPTPQASDPPRPDGTRIITADSPFGTMLFDRTGQAIYLFDKERTASPACYGACAQAWPPVLTTGDPQAGQGVREGLLGTTERRDGKVQVTYGGHPLYYYADEGKNQVLCHNVDEFGGLWLVVTPRGEPAPV
jgi:predicted lipoprotein with Yx(FWY)xxD motif